MTVTASSKRAHKSPARTFASRSTWSRVDGRLRREEAATHLKAQAEPSSSDHAFPPEHQLIYPSFTAHFISRYRVEVTRSPGSKIETHGYGVAALFIIGGASWILSRTNPTRAGEVTIFSATEGAEFDEPSQTFLVTQHCKKLGIPDDHPSARSMCMRFEDDDEFVQFKTAVLTHRRPHTTSDPRAYLIACKTMLQYFSDACKYLHGFSDSQKVRRVPASALDS
ncbi:hypothetical protein V5O48_016775 [Marasmius crinis-equi]|uniref:Uncharacterized protein n=1 Tax=Marasmius crinis-equi TaxID=585013 RepID=A0ABR3EQT0_9AGAR